MQNVPVEHHSWAGRLPSKRPLFRTVFQHLKAMTSGHFQATFVETKLDCFDEMSRQFPEPGWPKDDLLLILTNWGGGLTGFPPVLLACSLALHSNVLPKWFTHISSDRIPISDYLFLVIRISTGSSVTQYKQMHYPTKVLHGAVHAAVTTHNTLWPHRRTCSCFFA